MAIQLTVTEGIMNTRLPLAALTLILGHCLATQAVAQTTVAGVAARPPGATRSASLARFERLAADGDYWAAELAGRLYYEGRAPDGTVTRDLESARRHLEFAARNGSPGARVLLGRIAAGRGASADDEYVPGPGGC